MRQTRILLRVGSGRTGAWTSGCLVSHGPCARMTRTDREKCKWFQEFGRSRNAGNARLPRHGDRGARGLGGAGARAASAAQEARRHAGPRRAAEARGRPPPPRLRVKNNKSWASPPNCLILTLRIGRTQSGYRALISLVPFSDHSTPAF